jgi:hypothetical protein
MTDVLDEAVEVPEDATREELMAVIERLRAIVDERWSDAGIVASRQAPHGFTAALRTPFGSLLAAYCGGILRTEKTINYIAVDVEHPEDGEMVFCVHRGGDHSPLAHLVRLREENATLRGEAATLRDDNLRQRGECEGLRALIRDALDPNRLRAPESPTQHES